LRRTTAPQATNPTTEGPGMPGIVPSGLEAIATQTGSRRRAGPTTTRAARSPRPGCACRCRAARARAPGSHHESSSAKATNGVSAALTPTVRATAPRLRPASMTRTHGWWDRTACALPSLDPLSTTTTGGRSGSSESRSSVRSRDCLRSRVATTTVRSSGMPTRYPVRHRANRVPEPHRLVTSQVTLSPCCWVQNTRQLPSNGRGSFAPSRPAGAGSPSDTWMPVISLSPSL
jgi:hypothetical protein